MTEKELEKELCKVEMCPKCKCSHQLKECPVGRAKVIKMACEIGFNKAFKDSWHSYGGQAIIKHCPKCKTPFTDWSVASNLACHECRAKVSATKAVEEENKLWMDTIQGKRPFMSDHRVQAFYSRKQKIIDDTSFESAKVVSRYLRSCNCDPGEYCESFGCGSLRSIINEIREKKFSSLPKAVK
jgi:hypothetical protein